MGEHFFMEEPEPVVYEAAEQREDHETFSPEAEQAVRELLEMKRIKNEAPIGFIDKESLREIDESLAERVTRKTMGFWAQVLQNIEGYAVFSSTAAYLHGERSGDANLKQPPPFDMDIVVQSLDTLKHLRELLQGRPGVELMDGGAFQHHAGEQAETLRGWVRVKVDGKYVAEPFEIYYESRFIDEDVFGRGIDKIKGLNVLSLEGLQKSYLNNVGFEARIKRQVKVIVDALDDPNNITPEMRERFKEELKEWKERQKLDEAEPRIRESLKLALGIQYGGVQDEDTVEPQPAFSDDLQYILDRLEVSPGVLLDFFEGELKAQDLVKAFSGQKEKVNARWERIAKIYEAQESWDEASVEAHLVKTQKRAEQWIEYLKQRRDVEAKRIIENASIIDKQSALDPVFDKYNAVISNKEREAKELAEYITTRREKNSAA